MENLNLNNLCLTPMDESECMAVRGGDGWDKDVAKYIGFGLGYGAKKFILALRFLSKELYESQGRSMVIYK
ncbi:MAG: hypothetical protein RBT35_06530 [Bacteroidales bacterium]|nr:hypothetical protein [Bacteroidales bacterium]